STVMADAGEALSEPREFELKLEFDPADMIALSAHPLLAASKREAQRLISVYFDTDDLVLQKARICLRLRDTGHGYVQTIKAMDGAAHLFDRPEWEETVAGCDPNLALAAGTPLEPLLDERVRAELHPAFQTRIERDVYRVDSNGSEIEVAFDRGEIEAAQRWSPVHEVELELKHGNPVELFRLARSLSAYAALTLAVKTKAERGYELAAGAAPGAEKAAELDLDRGMTCQEAFRAIGENCLRQVIVNAPAVCAGEAPGLHQMRIGLRRLRAAIAAFSKLLADSERDRIKTELEWMTNTLGPARDLDVFEAEFLRLRDSGQGDDASPATTRRVFDQSRAEAYGAAVAAIGSERYRNLLLDAAEWIEAGAWTVDASLRGRRERSAVDHAVKMLGRERKRIKAEGTKLRKLGVKQRHRIRIMAKTLRYALEFFAGLFPGDKTAARREAALSALKDLQDELGALNDLAQSEALIASGHGLGEQAKALLTSKEADIDRLLGRAQAAHTRFAEVRSFWK
ncbi:MAG: CHAD domain-containing protein, partial [Methyloceanibacter sp.]